MIFKLIVCLFRIVLGCFLDDFSYNFMFFSASISVLIFVWFFHEKWLQKGPAECTCGAPLRTLFRTSIWRWILITFWAPFGSLRAPFGTLWGPFGRPLAPFGTLLAPLGTLLAPFGSPLAPLCTLWVPFGNSSASFWTLLAYLWPFWCTKWLGRDVFGFLSAFKTFLGWFPSNSIQVCMQELMFSRRICKAPVDYRMHPYLCMQSHLAKNEFGKLVYANYLCLRSYLFV